MQSEVMTITPEMAEHLLSLNTDNRPIRDKWVDELARCIGNGEWKLNGEPLILNGERLLDGQHRLLAIIKAGVSVESVVTTGVPVDTFATLGRNKPRTDADVFALLGVENRYITAGALKWIDQYLTSRVGRSVVYSNQEMIALLESHSEVGYSAKRCAWTRTLISPSVLAASHYLFCKIDADAAESFVSQLLSGADLEVGDGVYWLRERLLNNKLSHSSLTRKYLFALTIKAWNARRSGKSVRTLSWKGNSLKPEPFPIIR